MPNALARETSPYLLQHQNNPVDWHPWGPEAIARARREDKPIFLSIGYSACHWCHVMEHESFESEPIACYLNEHFVSIKVDREERPDLDQIYMNAVQIMTGHGGWPMSVFLTADLKPFYGGTYWPPEPRMGMPGFEQVLVAVNDAWRNRRDSLLQQADELTGHLQASGGREAPSNVASPGVVTDQEAHASRSPLSEKAEQLLNSAVNALRNSFDSRHGGFGRAPKFPHGMDLQLLLRLWKRFSAQAQPSEQVLNMVTHTLDRMAAGGIYDHLAGGFARYSVDERWLVPHFEKMLYDNALLTSAYLDAYLATREERFGRIAKETCRYILTYMTDAQGGFHSTEDADSEGEEGKFYVWTPNEIKDVLGDTAGEHFCYVYDVSEHGNFEHGKSILNLPKSIEQAARVRRWDLAELEKELAESRTKLLTIRDQRMRPAKDDKILVSWNALMIDALARAGRIVDEPEFVIAAEKAAHFICEKISRPDGRLLHTWRHGQAKLDAYLDDYAYFINSLLTLNEATFNERWIDEAARLADLMLKHFEDRDRGGFFFTADDHEALITRNKDLHDASVPSGNAMAATALLRLGKLCGIADYLTAAERTLLFSLSVLERMPAAAGQMLIALEFWRGPTSELVLVGGSDEPENQKSIAALQQAFLPRSVIAYRPSAKVQSASRSASLDSLFTGRSAATAPALYICENFACQAPLHGSEQIMARLANL